MVSDTVLRRLRPDDVHLVVHYDNSRFEGLLDGWTSALQSGLVEGGLRFQGTTVVPIQPRTGHGLLRDQAEQSLRGLLAGVSRPDLELPVGEVVPAVDLAGSRRGGDTRPISVDRQLRRRRPRHPRRLSRPPASPRPSGRRSTGTRWR